MRGKVVWPQLNGRVTSNMALCIRARVSKPCPGSVLASFVTCNRKYSTLYEQSDVRV